MGKTKKPFFAKHAKSSAALISLAIHAGIIMVALTFVAFKVIIKDDPVFVAKKVERPKMKLKKLQVPIKMDRRRKPAKIRKRMTAQKVRRKSSAISLPPVTGVMGGMGAMNMAGGIGADIGFSMPEINFFGVKKKSEKVVFIVLAGTASTVSRVDRTQSPKSRMCFNTLRARLNEMVHSLPEYALFNAAFFQAAVTTPFSTNMLLATQANKDLLTEWAAPVNPLHLEETYGSGNAYEGFWEKFSALDWYEGERLEGDDVPPVFPKWLYNYVPGSHIQKHFRGESRDERTFVHWNRAACFAFEQKPDTIFVLSTNYIGEDAEDLRAAFMDICSDIYGPDRKKYPTINVVIMNRVGQEASRATRQLDQYYPIINAFRGRGDVIEDIRDHMTPEEIAIMEGLDGSL